MIVAHNDNYNQFNKLLSKSLDDIQADANQRTNYYLKRGGVSLEKDVFRIINENAENTIFSNNIELISGQKFPDIVAYVNENNAYGIEVKTTNQNKWKSTGSSIFEGTRVDNVEKIHLLFAKLINPIEFKCRKYEDCLYDVAITHSPRYLIDMEISETESIFSKVGVEYDKLRKLENPFSPIKSYFRKYLKEGEDLWWIDNSEEKTRSLQVKLWGNLEAIEKDDLRIKALSYFPELLGSNPKKYAKLATWLVSQFGIVNHALRDTFSAGGKIIMNHLKYPKIYTYLFYDIEKIFMHIQNIPEDDIKYYWGINDFNKSALDVWINISLDYIKKELDKEQFQCIKKHLYLKLEEQHNKR